MKKTGNYNYVGKGPKADLYKGFRKDEKRGELPASEKKQLARREGRAENEKLYQKPNDRYTNGQLPDTKTPPPAKPKQVYGKPAKEVTVCYGNKKAPVKAASEKFKKTHKMAKAKPIKSIADLKGRAKNLKKAF